MENDTPTAGSEYPLRALINDWLLPESADDHTCDYPCDACSGSFGAPHHDPHIHCEEITM